MFTFQQTAIWQKTLAPQKKDPFERERSRLRDAFLNARESTRLLVDEIHTYLPKYTVHNIEHIDGLWEYADKIAGPGLALNPAEAFLLGLSFLLHDSGMSVAAYPNRLSDIKSLPIWADTLASKLRKAKHPLSDLEQNKVESDTTEDVLRLQHAEVAEGLGVKSWELKGVGVAHLIDDLTLRTAYGPVAGELAASHWLSVEEVTRKLNREFGSPPSMPPSWNVDLLKIAFLLRASDASQIDARRAPHFLRMLRDLNADSDRHWTFQGIINRPIVRDDRLKYTSTRPFAVDEADAWWLCHDNLRMIDRELRLIDSALAGAHRNYRFAAKGVASIESNSLIVSSIPVQGWHPIDASIRVGNIPALVKKLGGSQLYGDEPLIALRELIQNSCDAVRARRLLEERREDWGQVVISVDSNKENSYLRILDCGVGMSVEAITDGLLDFGNSYWNSELSRKELPTLASRGFKSTGKFGIGFFSVFMLGEDVKVQSRRYNAAAESATTLRFSDGVLNRPILTFGEVPELKDGGTLITVKLESSVAKRLLERNEDRTRPDLAARIVGVAPATDVTIILKGRGGVTLKANSWKSCSAGDLVRRAMEDKYIGDGMSRERLDEIISLNSEIVRDVLSSSGKLLGRGFVSIRKYDKYYNFDFGSAVVGGLVSGGLSGLGGIFLAETDVVTRDSARLTGDLSEYHGWLREQANLIKKQGISWDEGADLVETLLCAGLEDESVPALLAADGAITLAQFKERVERLDRFMLVQDASYSLICSQLVDNERISEELRLLDNVFVSKMGYRGVYVGDGHKEDAWGRLRHSGRSVDTLVASVGLKAWGISIAEEDIVNEKRQTGLRKNELVGHVGEREIFDSCYVYEKATFNKHQRRKQG